MPLVSPPIEKSRMLEIKSSKTLAYGTSVVLEVTGRHWFTGRRWFRWTFTGRLWFIRWSPEVTGFAGQGPTRDLCIPDATGRGTHSID